MKIKLGTMTLWQGIMHAMGMVQTSKLAVPKKMAKYLESTLCGRVNENYINFQK